MLTCVLVLWVLTSCSNNRLYEEYTGIEDQLWNIADTLQFEIPSGLSGQTILGIKYTQEYGYRNLYLRYELKDSLNNLLESQLLNIPLFESTSGKPLGKGFGSTYTKYDTLPLKLQQYHSIRFIQYMRIDELPGIEAVGIKLIR
jgi:gliding motility-associated lipoprotein GldH